MTARTIDGRWVYDCDRAGCRTEYDTREGRKPAAERMARQRGWKITNPPASSPWLPSLHRCPGHDQ
jgi:hypothetical protein